MPFPSQISNAPGVCSAVLPGCGPLHCSRSLGEKNSLEHCWFSSLLTSWERFVYTLCLIEVDFYLPAYFPVSNLLGKPHALVKTSSCETRNRAPPRCLGGTGGAQGCLGVGAAWQHLRGCPGHLGLPFPQPQRGGCVVAPPDEATRPLVPLAQGPVTNCSSSRAGPEPPAPNTCSCLILPAGAGAAPGSCGSLALTRLCHSNHFISSV